MTDPQNPVPYLPGEQGTYRLPPQQQHIPGPTYPQPRRRAPRIVAGVAIAVLLVAGAVAGTLLVQHGHGQTAGSAAAAAPNVVSAETTEPTTPVVDDFEITPKITQKQCFGSAGCNIEFRVDLAYNGPALDPDDTWLVTFEVHGVSDGPLIDSLTLTGDNIDGEVESASLDRSSDKLTAKVTAVQAN